LAGAGHATLALDMLGYGESDRPPDTDYGIAAQSEYVDRALAMLRIQRATVVGVDLGGAVAMRLAINHPGRVSNLVLINSLTRESTPAADVRTIRRNTARSMFQVATRLLGATPLLTPLLERSVADRANMPWRLVARYLAPYVGQDGVRQLLTLAASVRARDARAIQPADIRVPTLVLRGEGDQWLEDEVAVRLASAIPGARLVRIPKAGRLVPEEAPDQLVDLILDLVGGRAR
jgi:pimeloyl-ACP methyl ester carboxylesterase